MLFYLITNIKHQSHWLYIYGCFLSIILWQNSTLFHTQILNFTLKLCSKIDLFQTQMSTRLRSLYSKRKPYGWQVCKKGLLSLWPQLYHPRPAVSGDAAGVTTRGVRPLVPVNHMLFFLCHGFIKFMYIKTIDENKTLIFLYYVLQCELLCVPTSVSGFYQWVWILAVVLDFISGSGLSVGLDMKTPGADSILYHVIYTQPWHNVVGVVMGFTYNAFQRCPITKNLAIHVAQKRLSLYAQNLFQSRA